MRFFRALAPALLTLLVVLAGPTSSPAQVSIGISVAIAPPPLPIYEQPPIPGYGYIWMPGYWAYGPDGYYWVPGTWVLPVAIGLLWTPPWWGWSHGLYVFHEGYWGPHVGFYGGINYGYGYFGDGYEGGYWSGRRFYYNRHFNNFGHHRISYVYSRPMRHHGPENHVSFNGGTGGIAAQPSAQDRAAARERHWRPTTLQTQHLNAARSDRALHFTTNHGQPPIAATPRPGRFNSSGITTGTPRVHSTAPQPRAMQSTPQPPKTYRSTTPSGTPRTLQSAPRAPKTYRSPSGTPHTLQSAKPPKTDRSPTPRTTTQGIRGQSKSGGRPKGGGKHKGVNQQ